MNCAKFVVFCGPALVALSGCIQSHRHPVVVYATPAAVPARTSERPVDRVYTGPPPPVVLSPSTERPPAVANSDVTVAEAVGQLLTGDGSLAEASKNIRATVDRGVVTLRGTVPADHDRDEIVQRVSQIPGVVSVRDHLAVELR